MEGLKEYILREDAVAAVMETDPHVFLTYNKKKEKTDIVVAQITEEVLEEINKIPAADVVEVVRCKDCKYAHITMDGECKYCDIWFPDEKEYMPGDYYCASGERKNGDEK